MSLQDGNIIENDPTYMLGLCYALAVLMDPHFAENLREEERRKYLKHVCITTWALFNVLVGFQSPCNRYPIGDSMGFQYVCLG